MNNEKPNGTKILVLGGLGEVGKNMYAIECDGEIIVIDAGISFPEGELLGIDYVLPDFTYLKENEDKLKALFITHGHEDHIGGIPFLLQSVNIPAIYAPNQAKELIAMKLADRNIRYDNLYSYTDQDTISFNTLVESLISKSTPRLPISAILCKSAIGPIGVKSNLKSPVVTIVPFGVLSRIP